jgi:hypothetical protein
MEWQRDVQQVMAWQCEFPFHHVVIISYFVVFRKCPFGRCSARRWTTSQGPSRILRTKGLLMIMPLAAASMVASRRKPLLSKGRTWPIILCLFPTQCEYIDLIVNEFQRKNMYRKC